MNSKAPEPGQESAGRAAPQRGRRKLLLFAGLGVASVTATIAGAALLEPRIAKRINRTAADLSFRIKDAFTPQLTAGELAHRVFNPERTLVIGAGEASIAEFVDYNCSRCRSQHQVLKSLRGEGFAFRLFVRHKPKLGPASHLAAQAVIAATAQGRGHALHELFLEHDRKLEGEDVSRLAAVAGLDLHRFENDMQAASSALENDLDIAWSLRIAATPTFVTRQDLRKGPVPREDLLSLLYPWGTWNL